MKRFMVVLIAVLIMMSAFCAQAKTDGDYEFYETESGNTVITLYMGEDASVTVPEAFELEYAEIPFTVLAIADEAFAYNDDLRTIVIPEGVESIEYRAFFGCENLESVTLPSTLRNIGDEAFAYCSSLTQINLPEKLDFAGENIFYGCDALELTQTDIDALLHTNQTDRLEQQAAFSVDAGNLMDLSVYLATDLQTFVSWMGDMEDLGYTSGEGYQNADVDVACDDLVTYIVSIGLRQKSNYSLVGVYVSMPIDDAENLLLSIGWTKKQNSEQSTDFVDNNGKHVVRWVSFCDPNKNTLTCAVAEDGTVASVGLYMDYETEWAIEDGEFDPADILNYGGKNASGSVSYGDFGDYGSDASGYDDYGYDETSWAYATGDVFMREGPARGYDKVGMVPAGASVAYLNESQADERGVLWYYIDYDGMIGWASSKYIELGM